MKEKKCRKNSRKGELSEKERREERERKKEIERKYLLSSYIYFI